MGEVRVLEPSQERAGERKYWKWSHQGSWPALLPSGLLQLDGCMRRRVNATGPQVWKKVFVSLEDDTKVLLSGLTLKGMRGG